MKKKNTVVQKISFALQITLFYPHKKTDVWCKKLELFLDSLDRLNKRGIVVKVAWVIPVRRTLRPLLHTHRELVEHIKTRVEVGYDEINIYPSNSALLPLMTEKEIKSVFSEEIENFRHDGVKDIFKTIASFMPLPEGVFSPSILSSLQECRIQGISFNLFGIDGESHTALKKEITVAQRYNPLWLMKRGTKEKIIFLPSFNSKDVKNRGGLRSFVLELRAEQMKNPKIGELLLLIDERLDSSLWFDTSKSITHQDYCLVEKTIEKLARLPFLIFSTPDQYVSRQPPRGILLINHDCIFYKKGYLTDFADRWENREIWSRVEKSRLYCERALTLAKESGKRKIQKRVELLIDESVKYRMSALSSRYLNPNSPNSKLIDLKHGLDYSRIAWERAMNAYQEVQLSVNQKACDLRMLNFRASLLGVSGDDLQMGDGFIENNYFILQKSNKSVANLYVKDAFKKRPIAIRCGLTFGGITFWDRGEVEYISSRNGMAQMAIKGRLKVNGIKGGVPWKHLYTLSAGLPYLFVNVEMDFSNGNSSEFYSAGGSATTDFSKKDEIYLPDYRLKEIMPVELLLPPIPWNPEKIRIWKDSLQSGQEELFFSAQALLEREPLFHSQIARSWMAFNTYDYGVLVAQKRSLDSSFGFCPVLFTKKGKRVSLRMNLMGSYRKPTCKPKNLSLYNFASFLKEQIQKEFPVASYVGHTLNSSFMIAPFRGKTITEKMIQDSLDFSTQIYTERYNDRDHGVTG